MRGLNIRIEFAKANLAMQAQTVCVDEDGVSDAMWAVLEQVEAEGFLDGLADRDIPALYRDQQPLVDFWNRGNDSGAFAAEAAESSGTQAEWEALSEEEQDAEWDNFHSLNEKGVADDMYFYRVLMDMHLVGYVGH